MKTAHPPTPEDLWGDCTIAGWTPRNQAVWNLWLTSIARLIIFADQNVIDRVIKVISETIAKAKEGTLSPEKAIRAIRPSSLITQDEWEVINSTARNQGRMIMQFYSRKNNDGRLVPNN